jgi:hypothetical protein
MAVVMKKATIQVGVIFMNPTDLRNLNLESFRCSFEAGVILLRSAQ